MAVTFPSITPSSRSFSAPVYPVTSFRSQSGTTTRRLWASAPSNARLSLTYSNISDDNAAAIVNCYLSALGSVEELSLPSAVFSGASNDLARYMNQTGTFLIWHFADDTPPKVDSVTPGRSSVTVELIASLDRT